MDSVSILLRPPRQPATRAGCGASEALGGTEPVAPRLTPWFSAGEHSLRRVVGSALRRRRGAERVAVAPRRRRREPGTTRAPGGAQPPENQGGPRWKHCDRGDARRDGSRGLQAPGWVQGQRSCRGRGGSAPAWVGRWGRERRQLMPPQATAQRQRQLMWEWEEVGKRLWGPNK